MSNKINLLIDTVPYVPDVFNNLPSLYNSDIANSPNIIPTYQTIFVFSLNSQNASTNSLNNYNNPYFMMYGLLQPTINYYLSPISYFSTNYPTIDYSSSSNLIKTLYKSYVFTPEIIELLGNIGYNVKLATDGITPLYLFPPSDYSIPNTSPLYDSDILFQKLSIYDAVTGRTDEIIFIYFYQDYITDNPIHLNNSYINNTSQTPFQSSVYYNKNNWNVFIYPFVLEERSLYTSEPNVYYPTTSVISSTSNFVETLNFDNKDYCPYINKLEYKYFENQQFVKDDNKLNTSMMHSKNLISFGKYYANKNDSSDDTIYISLNEITKSEDINNYINSDSESNTIKFLSKSKSYANTNNKYSMSYDNKMSYINNKINSTDLTYATYFFPNSRIETMYPICKNLFVNTYVNIKSLIGPNGTINDYLQSTNWYVRKLLLQINPLIIDSSTNVTLEIHPLINCKNNLTISGLQVIYPLGFSNLESTNNYYIDRFRLVAKWSEVDSVSTNTVNFVYYIILNIAYYNSNNLVVSNTTKTNNVDDLGYINFTYADYSNTLVPTIFQKLTKTNIYSNLIDYNLIDTKYYSLSLNYNSLSTNVTQNNLIFINHFYYLIPYINPTINYTYINTDQQSITLPISNVYNILEKKINNFIMNTIFLNDNFISIKFNNYNTESIFKLSVSFDSNILNDYENCINGNSTDCQNKDYIDYLQYINNNFGGDPVKYMEPINFTVFGDYTPNSIMIPTGNYIVFKYHNNFITRDNIGIVEPMDNDTVLSLFYSPGVKLADFSSISQYNFALLIKLDDDFNPDDTFYVNNQNLYTTDFYKIYKYFCNQGNYQTKMYLVPCNTNYSLYYFTGNTQIPYLVGIELFNNYNGVITNGNQSFVGNKVFMNMVLNEYMNFYELNFIVDVFDTMKQNNSLCFDKNNLLFKKHHSEYLNQIVKYDSLRFNSNVHV